MTPAAATALRQRANADERRDQVIRAAIQEFAEAGYEGASTAAIAKRAGISQPYIYALFPSKRDLFLAVYERSTNRIRDLWVRAAKDGATPMERLKAMGEAYKGLIADRVHLLCQLQAYATAGDPEVRPAVARGFRALFDDAVRISGAAPDQVALFFAIGMLANITTALGVEDICVLAFEGKRTAG